MKVNKKLVNIFLIIITLFTITLSVYALNPNDYINGKEDSEQTEQPQESNQQEDNAWEETTGDDTTTDSEYEVVVEDDAARIVYTDEEKLKTSMESLRQEGNIIFKSISYNTKSTKEYAEEYYRNRFGEESGILILFDYGQGKVYLYTEGEVGTKFTSEQAQKIIDDAMGLVNDKKTFEAVSQIVSDLENVLGLKTSISEDKNGHTLLIEDDANLLTPEEEEKLKEKMKPLTKYGHIVFKSISINPNGSTKEFANNFYYSKFGNESGTIFIIDMDERMIWIVSAGENYKTVTDSKADIITDNIYKYASRKEYYECAYNAFDQIETILDGGKIAEPMRHISNAVVAIVLAFFVNFFIVLGASKIKKANAAEIIKNCDVEFEASNVSGSKTGTHKVYSPVSESSGGSSGGGGGGGGGGFSGGGGGHSF